MYKNYWVFINLSYSLILFVRVNVDEDEEGGEFETELASMDWSHIDEIESQHVTGQVCIICCKLIF